MTDAQKADYKTMKAISPYTKLSPNERVRDCESIIKIINDSEAMVEIKNNIIMDGYCMPKPDLHYSGATIKPD